MNMQVHFSYIYNDVVQCIYRLSKYYTGIFIIVAIMVVLVFLYMKCLLILHF